jgi:hypothetical protein
MIEDIENFRAVDRTTSKSSAAPSKSSAAPGNSLFL